jgi:hypothetical protein
MVIRALINFKKSKISTYISNLLSQALRLKLKGYQLLYTIILTNIFFINFDIIIRTLISYQYRTILYCSNLNIYSDFLIERISLIFEQSDQIY